MARQIQPVFVVGTGRCGSTMLSNMLREHRDVLSLSEFLVTITDFGSRTAHAFPESEVTGEQAWSVLGTCPPKARVMLRHGVEMDEFLYQLWPTARFNRQTGVPAILLTTLPHLTAHPDQLFDELREYVIALEPARAVVQYRRAFEWLQRRFNKKVWIERSGGSLRAVPRLAQSLPDARFVHIVRDGRDCAISMSRHTGFRMMMAATMMTMILGYDPFDNDKRTGVQDLPDYLYKLLPENFDADTFDNMDAPPALFGMHWSGEIKRGLAALAALPQERVLTLRFEDILADPEPHLRALIEFVDPELADEDWVRKSAALVRPVRSSWQKLDPQAQAALTGTCSPGLAALAECGLTGKAQREPAAQPRGASWVGLPLASFAAA